MAAVFADLATFCVALWFENVSWLEENLASVLVNLLEPVPQSLVPVRIIVQHIDRILDLVHTSVVGKPFEERPQFTSSLTKSGVLYVKTVNYSRYSRIDGVLAWTTSLVPAWTFFATPLPWVE